jgi:hypothetical protein
VSTIAITSVKSGGATTTALAVALSWPRPVLLVEADPTGSSSILSGYFRGTVAHDRGVFDLAKAKRDNNNLVTQIETSTLQVPGGRSNVRLLPGLTGPAQAGSMSEVWDDTSSALTKIDRSGTDIIIDAGRLGQLGSPAPLLRSAGQVLLLTRTTLPALAALRGRSQLLSEELTAVGQHGAAPLRVVLVGEGQPYTSREIKKVIQTPLAPSVAWDPVSAEVYSLGATPSRRFASTPFQRSIGKLAANVEDAGVVLEGAAHA